jgi:hypothetical protein
MAGLFGGSPPAPQAQAAAPQEDDEAARRARLKAATRLQSQPSGRLANQLGQGMTAKSTYTPAQTRKGVTPLAGAALLTG